MLDSPIFGRSSDHLDVHSNEVSRKITTTTELTVPMAPRLDADAYEVGSYASASIVPLLTPAPHVRGNSETGRPTRAVLEDLFFVYTGCASTKDFFALQAAGAELRRRVRQGATFQHKDVRPRILPQLQEWHKATQAAAAVVAAPSSAGGESSCISVTSHRPSTMAATDSGGEEGQSSRLIPSRDELPSTTRADEEAIATIRRYVEGYLARLRELVTVVLGLDGRWGLLYQQDLINLNEALDAEKRARVSLEDFLVAFQELDFTDEGVNGVTDEIGRCENVRSFCMSSNPMLTRVNVLPPRCHTVIASACALREIKLSAPASQLVILGVSYNQLENLDFLQDFPVLRVLDVSYNRLASLPDVVGALHQHTHITEVVLAGNPMALLDTYRRRLATECPQVEKIDHRLIRAEERRGMDEVQAVTPRIATPQVPNGRRKSIRVSKKKDLEPEVTVNPEEAAELRWRLNNTVASGVEVLLVEGLAVLGHTPLTLTSADDLDPQGALFQRLTGADQQFLNSATPGLVPSTRAQSVSGSTKRGPTKQAGTSRTVQLYECESVLKIRGVWGDEELGEDYRISINVEDIPLTLAPPGDEKGKPTAAASRLRKALAAAATAIEDHFYPKEGVFAKDLALTGTLAEKLRGPIVLRVEVHDTVRYQCFSHLKGALEGAPAASGKQRPNSKGGPTPGPLPEGTPEPQETHVYTLGTILIHPEALLAQDHCMVPPPEGIVGDSLTARREIYAQHCSLQRSSVDRDLEEEGIYTAREALRQAVAEWSHTYSLLAEEKSRAAELESSMPSMQPGQGGGRRGSGGGASHSRKAAAKLAAQRVTPTQLQYQSELEAHQQTVVRLGAQLVARESRVSQLWDAGDVFLDARLWIGRGAAPPCTAELTASYAERLQAAAPQQRKGRGRPRK